jgi:hypothetical protein
MHPNCGAAVAVCLLRDASVRHEGGGGQEQRGGRQE